jgi:hypothetical protein
MKKYYNTICLIFILLHISIIAYGSTRKSPSGDELGHLASGIALWETNRLDLYRVHPPLIRLVAASPIMLIGHIPFNVPEVARWTPGWRLEWEAARNMVDSNRPGLLRMITLARWACIPFAVLGALICSVWSRELAGDGAGLLSLGLWCLSPAVLGCGILVTPDLAAASCGLLASYLLWRWLRHPGWAAALYAGLGLGAAELSKFIWVIAYALWPVLWAAWRQFHGERTGTGRRNREFVQLILIVVISIFLINLFYAFEGTGTRLGRYRFISRAMGGPGPSMPASSDMGRNPTRGTWLGELPVPLPTDYVQGIDIQKRDFESGMTSYFLGEFRTTGWWYYYLVGIALKEPVGTLLILAIASYRSVKGDYDGVTTPTILDNIVLLAIPAAILTLLSCEHGFTHHMRYALPALPYAYIWAGRAAGLRPMRLKLKVLTCAAVIWGAGSSLVYFPHSLSYFNEFAGGPGRAHRYMGCGPFDSSLDWGQDLILLREWLRNNPRPKLNGIDYDGTPGIFRAAGIEPTPMPQSPHPGRYAVGLKQLYGQDDRYRHLQRLQPVARLGYSLFIFDVTEATLQETKGHP